MAALPPPLLGPPPPLLAAVQAAEAPPGPPPAAVAAAAAAAPPAAAAAGPPRAQQPPAGHPIKRRRGGSPVWSKFRLLGAADAPHTHECTICGEKIQVYNKRQTNIPLVTEARRHLETKHPADLKRLETSAPGTTMYA